jgi:hypothetical protein
MDLTRHSLNHPRLGLLAAVLIAGWAGMGAAAGGPLIVAGIENTERRRGEELVRRRYRASCSHPENRMPGCVL